MIKKYMRFPIDKPEVGRPIYIIGPNGKEQLAKFIGGTRFDFHESERKGYYARNWRNLNDVEQKSFDDAQPAIRVKRKYTKRKGQ